MPPLPASALLLSPQVNAKAMALLKQPIFKATLLQEDGTYKDVPPEEAIKLPPGTIAAGGKIVVNFDPELTTLIRESKYLDRMGFPVPETALNVTLQEDKYHAYVEALRAMLASHAQARRRRAAGPACASSPPPPQNQHPVPQRRPRTSAAATNTPSTSARLLRHRPVTLRHVRR